MHRLAAMLLALFAPFAAGAQRRAPPLDARQLPPGAFDLTQSWRVHEGDNSAWADPDFDDSVWATESLDSRSASAQGWRWFRVSIRLPQESTVPLSLLIDGRDGAYELFMDGQRVPGPSLRSPLLVTDPRDRSFPFTRPAAVVHLALRVHIAKRLFDRAAAFHSVALAPAPVVAAKQSADNDARLMSILPSLGINLALLLAGIGALGLYFAQKGRGEYLWLGVFLAALGGGAAAFGLYYSSVVPVSINWFLAIPVNYTSTIALIEFIFRFAGRRVSRPWRIYESLFLLAAVACPWLVWFGILGYGPYNVIEALVIAPASLLLPVLLFRWYTAGNREAGWLILPTLFPTTTLAFWDIGVVMQYFGLPGADRLLRPRMIGPLAIQAFDLADAVFLLAIGVVMFFRFTRISHEQARAASEMEAAHRVQGLLLRSQQRTDSRLRIDTVYRPAQEVGGDFFHTAKIGGRTRIVVGDVSGKGLGAAMLVSALIGALDSTAAAEPAIVLRTLNDLLLLRQQGGFATCLCAAIATDGFVTLANAGHLAPYRNGEELPIDNGLPLGITPEAHYSETIHQLSPGDTLTLLSDGVVEARDSTGELFGFDRTRDLSTQSADTIARAAQAFGQQDDITVLTLTFAPAEVFHA
jgi:sigma-B regulation protein RsbU (phosphoserine phosphatase)